MPFLANSRSALSELDLINVDFYPADMHPGMYRLCCFALPVERSRLYAYTKHTQSVQLVFRV